MAKLSPPYIPFMPLLLKGNKTPAVKQFYTNHQDADCLCSWLFPDMTFIHEGNPNYIDKLVNFEKMVCVLLSLFLFTSRCKRLHSICRFSCCRHSECSPRQLKLYEDAEANHTVRVHFMDTYLRSEGKLICAFG